MNLIAVRDVKLPISQIDETRNLEIMKFKDCGATAWAIGNLLTCLPTYLFEVDVAILLKTRWFGCGVVVR